MDITTLISSLGISVTGVWWLSQKIVEQKLAKDLEKNKNFWLKQIEETKAEFQQKLEKDKAEWNGEIRKEVEIYLGDKSAEREYILEARKRLYIAIGPLKFQLLVACRDVYNRVQNHGISHSQYNMAMEEYYGRNTLYRLLRPLAIAELIERQITYADFSIDAQSIELLRFKKAAFTAFTNSEPILNHPNASWNNQNDHIFSGTLIRLINELIIPDKNNNIQEKVMHWHEFESLIADHPENLKKFSPLQKNLDNFQVVKNPIFWTRLVCFGYICNEFVGRLGNTIGFEKKQFDVHKLLSISNDHYILSNIEKFQAKFSTIINMDL